MKYLKDILIIMSILTNIIMVFSIKEISSQRDEANLMISEQSHTITDSGIQLSEALLDLSEAREAIEDIRGHMELLIALEPIEPFMDPIDKDYLLRFLDKGRVFDSRTRMTSSFGESTGIQNRWRGGHRGLDLVPDGDWHIIMPWDGVSSSIGIDEVYGKYVIVNITDNIRVLFGHLNVIFYTAVPNKELKKGDVIGTMGNTGMSTAAHLHFELQVFTGEKWEPLDPSPWLDRS